MKFNTKHNLFSFSRVAAVKQWGLGWTVAEAARGTSRPPQCAIQQRPAPGTYGLLVEVGRPTQARQI